MNRTSSVLVLMLVIAPMPVVASPLVIDFEGFVDGQAITAQVPGVSFSNATVLTAGSSLNDLEFPPHSGAKAIFDDGGPVIVDFTTPMSAVRGYFNYALPLSFSAYDLGLNLVGTQLSTFSSNLALSGNAGSAPNELLGVSFVGGISRVVIAGDPPGTSFTLDDFTFEPRAVNGVPEPDSLPLVVGALVLGAAVARRRGRRRES